MSGFNTIIVPVTDIARSRDFYRTLIGNDPFMDESYYVGFKAGDTQLGLDPHGTPGSGGPIAYWHATDISGLADKLVAAGALVVRPVSDVGGGKLVAVITDPDGNSIGLSQDAVQ
jgi:predicted enzyme related to lactoylglutathione lyase